MKSRSPTLFAGVAMTLLLAVLLPAASTARSLSAKELKKAVKEAGKAFGAGRYDQAIGLYDQILASTPAGDARRGQSLVVWAITEGRKAARAVDEFLMGSSTLPAC